ncbi:MAG: hypothetical protein JXQ97_07400 [Natronospirillum sp.]
MSTKPEILIFSSDAAKRRNQLIRFGVGLAIVIGIVLLRSVFQANAYVLLVLAVSIFSGYMNFIGIYNPFWKHDEVIITPVALKGASLQRAGRAYFMLDDFLIEPILVKRSPPKWLQWLYPNRVWLVINQHNHPYGLKMDLSLLSDQDQQTVLSTLQQRYSASMPPIQ